MQFQQGVLCAVPKYIEVILPNPLCTPGKVGIQGLVALTVLAGRIR